MHVVHHNDIPEGVYRLKMIDYWTRYVEIGSVRKASLVVDFVITESPHTGCIVPRWYNVQELIGKPRRKGRFRAKSISDPRNRYVSEYRQITGKNGLKTSRVSPAAYKGIPLEGRLIMGRSGPKFAAVWNPNRYRSESGYTLSTPEMYSSFTNDAPRMHRIMSENDAPVHYHRKHQIPANSSFPEGNLSNDTQVADLRGQHLGEREKGSMGGCEYGESLDISLKDKKSAIASENNNRDDIPPANVGAKLWRTLDDDEREWLRDYSEHLNV